MKAEKSHCCHGGTVEYFVHDSEKTGTPMRFSLFQPPKTRGKTPYVIFLAGLTCTEENFTTKANAYKKAAELGIAVLAPDTSPRGENVSDDDAYDLGQGAGFYLDAKQSPWDQNFQMESYIIDELLPLVENDFKLDANKKSIMGHSMGGHGALTLYFRYPSMFASCSAFAPVVAPSRVPWGKKAFSAYLGPNESDWMAHDACSLVTNAPGTGNNPEILIDQGLDDPFLEEQLKPELFEDACKTAGQSLNLRRHKGYDHSYFFIQTFIDDHLKWHAENL